VFVIQVLVAKEPIGVGKGASKQDASLAAAAMALHRLGEYAPEYAPDEKLEAAWPLPDRSMDEEGWESFEDNMDEVI
jgi:hypothetical protein